ncbi:hypothetical protein ACLIYN_17235, partial [Streptomyces atacamensis]
RPHRRSPAVGRPRTAGRGAPPLRADGVRRRTGSAAGRGGRHGGFGLPHGPRDGRRVATAAGLAAAPLLPSPLPTALAGALVVPAAFTAAALAVRAPEVPQLLTAVTRRFRHVR